MKINVNSLAPGRFGCDFKNLIFNLVLLIGILRSLYENALRWMPQNITDKSTLVQVMAWCCQAASYYLSQCWPRSMSPYGVIRPQWVNTYSNRLISQIPQCIRQISHNAPFRNTCAHFCYEMVHCGMWHRCILGFVRWVHLWLIVIQRLSKVLSARFLWLRVFMITKYLKYKVSGWSALAALTPLMLVCLNV